MIIMTWTRDSDGLFDYRTDQLETTKLSTSQNSYLVRDRNTVSLVNQNIDPGILCEKLMRLYIESKCIF